jgi:hypothetical protein
VHVNSQEQALQLAELGWRILPIKPGQKRPPMASWQHAATNNPRTIHNWYNGLYKDHGIGIATGPQPNGQNLIVVDIDEHDPAKSGTSTLRDLEKRYGALPFTVRATTGSNGQHIYLLAPPSVEIRNDAGSRLGVGIDIRGDGGQVLAPPTVHPNGNLYQWQLGMSPADVEPAPMPAWMLGLIQNPAAQQPTTPLSNDGDGPAARFNSRTTWSELLTRDGWTEGATDPSGETHWTRPGKNPKEGTSATTGYRNQDVLVVFTSSIDWLPAGAYSKFGYYACRNHGGDRSEAARALLRDERQFDHPTIDELMPTVAVTATGQIDDIDANLLKLLIDWPVFWEQDHTVAEWLAEPIIAEARAHAIFAPGGTGKSMLSLFLSAAIATGTPIFGHPQKPRRVLYLDYEMTPDDLAERLESMGYGPEYNLSNLQYALLPDLDSLDSVAGGKQVARLAELVSADLVVIDTFGRAVSGDENEADTVRAFYRNTGIHLKKAGRAFLRIDHAGKDAEKGQRGSSAKNDDVDIVWQLTRSGKGQYQMKTRKARMSWIPEKIDLRITDDPFTFHIAHEPPTPDGTDQLVTTLDNMNVDARMSGRKVRAILTENGYTASNATLRAAMRHRARRADAAEADDDIESYLI